MMTIGAVSISLNACSQENSNNAPQKVQAAFEARFPDAKKVEWEMENDEEWEAEFKMKGKEYSANFSIEGEWLETEYEIKEKDIPATIRTILDQNFSNYEIEDPEIAETPSGKSYEMEIEVNDEEFEVVIDSNGNLTKKKEDEEGDEDND